LEWTFSENAGQKYFRYRIEEDENGIVFVAFSDNVPVGYICGCKFRHKARTKQNMAEIENMFVEGNFRNQGVGKLLIDAFLEKAKKLGAERLKVGAIFENEKAISFYQKNGFKKHEIILEKDI